MRKIFKILEIETTNYCNRKCWYCPFHTMPNKKKEYIDEFLINKIICELKELQYNGIINWFSLNEPLLDRRICDIIKKTKDQVPNSRPRLFTNGDPLTQSLLDNLFDNGLWELSISLHDEKASERIAKLDFSKKNVKTVKYYDRTEIDLFNRAGLIPNLVHLKNTNFQCNRPSLNMVIKYNGKLKLCAEDQLGMAFDDSLNVRFRTLESLWNSDEMESYRKKLIFGRRNLKMCQDCNFLIRTEGDEGYCERAEIPLL